MQNWRFLKFWLFCVLIFCSASKASMADSVLTLEAKNFLKSLIDITEQCSDDVKSHYYVYPQHPSASDAICNTYTNPYCTQEHVFETMKKEARFVAPTDNADAKQPVVDGEQIQLANGIPINGKSYTASAVKLGLGAFLALRAGVRHIEGFVLPPISAELRKKYSEEYDEFLASLGNSPSIYDNRIQLRVDAASYTVTNVTLSDHLFYSGTVDRIVSAPDGLGNIYVKTIGKGTGNKFGVAKCLNLAGEAGIWYQVNELLRNAMKPAPILVIDRSGSLTDQPGVMQQIQSKAAEVVQAIRVSVGQAAVINFSGTGDASTDAPFTSDPELLLKAIQSPSTKSTGTAIYDAVENAVALASSRDNRSMLLLFTDGMNNQGSGLEEAIRYCQEKQIAVIVVGFMGTEGRNENELNKLAASTGGFYVPNESATIKNVLERFGTYAAAKNATRVKGTAE